MCNFSQIKAAIIAISLLVASLTWAPLADAAPGGKGTAKDNSDLNKDRVVNTEDLILFSSRYLETDWESVDWCSFYDATANEADLYGRPSSYYTKHFSKLLGFINVTYGCDLSDLNGDGVVDMADLFIFSNRYLELNMAIVDWCAFYEAVATEQRYADKITSYYGKHFGMLLGYIYDQYGCSGGSSMLNIKNSPRSLTRLAHDVEYTGNYYVSDARVNSVFIYDPNLLLIGELKNLDKPLGIAIDSQGYLLVGNNGRNNIEVYDADNGDLLATFGEGLVRMPTTINVGSNGDIYVTDSKAHRIWVFESSYVHVRTIGMPGTSDGQLKFPTDLVIIPRDTGTSVIDEIYISDRGNRRIQVFDTHGNFERTIGPSTTLSSWCLNYGFFCKDDARGTFNKLQALAVDSVGRIHSLDIFEAAVTIIDPISGEMLGSYGAWGDDVGQLRVPLDLLVTDWGSAIITDNNRSEMEVFTIP